MARAKTHLLAGTDTFTLLGGTASAQNSVDASSPGHKMVTCIGGMPRTFAKSLIATMQSHFQAFAREYEDG